MPDAQRATFERLGALGYVAAIYDPPGETGVVHFDQARAEAGLNLYCSGHAAEAFLVDMTGRPLHRWSLPYAQLPDAPPPKERFQGVWRRVRMLADGSLLAIYEGLAVAKVDRDSRLLWSRVCGAHHDLDVTPEGHILVLTRAERVEPALGTAQPIVEDSILELDGEGTPLRTTSIVRALLRSRWAGELIRAARAGGDFVHANTVELLRDEPRVDHRAFRPGRVLVALRQLDALAVIDLETEQAEWWRRGPWVSPHQPTVLPDGHLLVFDNMGNRGCSRVVAYDERHKRIAWQYSTDPPEEFFSIFSGAAQRLPGGNTLITESYKGRAIEVTPAGEVVWEFLSPHRAGGSGELVAVLFEVERTFSWPDWLRIAR